MPSHMYDSYDTIIEALGERSISGKYLYLAEIFPLVEVVWADGQNQESEIEILHRALEKHVQQINSHAGFDVFTFDEAKEYISPLLTEKPDKELLELLRRLYVLTLENIHDEARKKEIINSFLSYSLDIAASCVTRYPFNMDERFELPEKECFFSILKDIGVGGIHLTD